MNKSLIALRRTLHQFPELSGEEKETSSRILNFLSEFNPTKIISNIGGHGLAAIYQFSNSGTSVLIRCELDALPIQESNEFEHRSKVNGVAHKCGHDGHMAIVAGLAPWLEKSNFVAGKVILLFQPAEETGHGAQAIINDPKWKEISYDYAFALHNLPGYKLGKVFMVNNTFNTTVQSLNITLKGRHSHAAEPEKGLNPALCCSQLITQLNSLNISNSSLDNYRLLTVVYLKVGEQDYGMSAGYGELHLTIRTYGIDKMKILENEIKDMVKDICSQYRIHHNISWFDFFPAVQNNKECNQIIKNACNQEGIDIRSLDEPIKFGEDFGWFSQLKPSAMCGIGSGLDSAALHQEDYDFPDNLIPIGVRLFQGIITQLLERQK